MSPFTSTLHARFHLSKIARPIKSSPRSVPSHFATLPPSATTGFASISLQSPADRRHTSLRFTTRHPLVGKPCTSSSQNVDPLLIFVDLQNSADSSHVATISGNRPGTPHDNSPTKAKNHMQSCAPLHPITRILPISPLPPPTHEHCPDARRTFLIPIARAPRSFAA